MNKIERNEKIYEFIKILSYKFIRFDLVGNAAQIGFYLLLSILPLTLFVISLIPLFNIDEQSVINTVNILLTNETLEKYAAQLIDSLLNEQNTFALSFSIIFVLYSASNAISTILKVVDKLYNDRKTKNYLITRFRAFYLTAFFVVLVLLLVSTYTLSSNFLLTRLHLPNIFIKLILLFKYLLLPIFIFIFLFTCYLIGSNQKFRYRTYIPGTLFAIVFGYISTFFFEIYINNFSNYSIQYGAIGFLIVALLWLLLLCVVILTGALINAVYAQFLIEYKVNIIRGNQKKS